ncbi:MAG: hypothetical protein JJT89_01195 [Nitriliruptoraceae bacterium]|nr:hypothetical protein [Nitriliruptoraceae bacterium]
MVWAVGRTTVAGASASASDGLVADTRRPGVLALDLDVHEVSGHAGPPPADAEGPAALVLDLLQESGPAGLSRMYADGAFILVDPDRRRVVLWRDPLGTRPLFIARIPRGLVLASDLRSVVAHPEVAGRLDLAYAHALLLDHAFFHPTRTLIDGVTKAVPGDLLELGADEGTRHPTWRPSEIPARTGSSLPDLAAEACALTREAVRCRLGTDRSTTAAHLSGGLDSSSIAVLAARELRAQGDELVAAYSWAPSPDAFGPVRPDERWLPQQVADDEQLLLRWSQLNEDDVDDFLYRDIALRPRETLHFEIGVSRVAAEAGARQMMSGWGGDEFLVFNGRGYFADLARRGRIIATHRALDEHARILGRTPWRSWRARVAVPLLPQRLIHHRRRVVRTDLPSELRPAVARQLAAVEPLRHPSLVERPGVRRMQLDLLNHGHLSNRMDAWASRGVEVGILYRFPMLDRRLVEFALSLPPEAYMHAGWKRWIYREAMNGVLPDAVRWNPDKFDVAAAAHLSSLHRRVIPTRGPVRLEEHRDNPYVDVDVLLDRTHVSPSNTAGNALWLAFCSLSPPD